MAVLAPMSDLEAVNRMLASIGGSPVNTLTVPGVGDVADATRQLTEALRDVETVGYSWNTDYNLPLTPDANGRIALPNGALDVDSRDTNVGIVVRRLTDATQSPPIDGLYLYDAVAHSFVFDSTKYNATSPLLVDVIWGFAFNDLPQPARTYIATAAARRFQAQKVNSTILDKYGAEDEERAFILLQRYERRSRNTNSFRSSAQLQRWMQRRSLLGFTKRDLVFGRL
jgi:hypothetical protein